MERKLAFPGQPSEYRSHTSVLVVSLPLPSGPFQLVTNVPILKTNQSITTIKREENSLNCKTENSFVAFRYIMAFDSPSDAMRFWIGPFWLFFFFK